MASASSVAELESPSTVPENRTRRPWISLILAGLGLAAFFSPALWQQWPDTIPAMPTFMASMWGPGLATIAIAVGWLIGGSVPLRARFGYLALAVLLVAGAVFAAHPTARFYVLMKAVPLMTGVGVLFLFLAWRFSSEFRLRMVIVLAVLTLSPWLLFRFNGVTGQFGMDGQWRWHPDAEAAAAAYDTNTKADASTTEAILTVSETDWPCFRGPRQDGIVNGVQLGDWQTQPKELWRRPVGPGWSSFCIVGDRLYTQEQRKEEELVVCYRASTGAQLWATGDSARYSDMPSGVGPRGTPTFHDGKIYAFGATGILNCLDAATGKRLWQVDVHKTLGLKASPFGYASSPLAMGDRIIVHPGSDPGPEKTGPRLAAYHARTGEPLWTAGTAAIGYSTPHRATIGGVEQVLVFSGDGLFSHDPVSGKELWAYEWKAEMTAPVCVQPLLLPGDRILLGSGRPGIRSRCIKLNKNGEQWTTEDVWESPYAPAFNDCVCIGDNIYGLETGRLVCLDAKTGKRRWKEGDYGAGQVLLAGNRLLVLSEKGKLAMVNPIPESWQQLTIFSALSDKTWNHPVIAHGKLFIRNSEEMVCYEVGK
jgi:outer membrane protein assembly factor BamB